MKRFLLVLLVLMLAVVAVPRADAKKKAPPPIPFSNCAMPLSADQAGRTYLMTTGEGPCVTDGVHVTANNVTIDLGGFRMTGNGGGGGTKGILLSAGVTGTRIKHGNIEKFAIAISGPNTTSGTIVSGIAALQSSNTAIFLGPATIKNSLASAGGGGIAISGLGTGTGIIKNSIATDDAGQCFSIIGVDTGLIDRSTCSRATTASRNILMANKTSTVRRTSVIGGSGSGVEMDGSVKNVVDRFLASGNTGQGVVIDATAKAPLVTRSTITGNGHAGFEEGIVVDTPDKATVTSNKVFGNFGDGIKVEATNPAIVDGNTADSNGWGVKDGNSFGINSPSGSGHNHAVANDGDNQCTDDALC